MGSWRAARQPGYAEPSNAPARAMLSPSAPVVLTSRADSNETKFNSIALAAAIS